MGSWRRVNTFWTTRMRRARAAWLCAFFIAIIFILSSTNVSSYIGEEAESGASPVYQDPAFQKIPEDLTGEDAAFAKGEVIIKLKCAVSAEALCTMAYSQVMAGDSDKLLS